MTEIIQSHKPLNNDREQAGYYHARNRSRSFRDVTKGLFKTHDFGVANTDIDTDVVFPDRTRPITFHTQLGISDTLPEGMICEFGGATTGFAMSYAFTGILWAVGDGTASSNTGADGEILFTDVPAFISDGALVDLTVAILPGKGEIRIWVNGAMKVRAQAAAGNFGDPSEWTGTGNGSVGSAQADATTQRRSFDVTTPNGFALVKPFKVFMGQIPRFFNESLA